MHRRIFVAFLVFALPVLSRAEKNPFNGFIENKGQWEASVKYRKKVPQGFLLLQNTGWTYYLSNTWSDKSHGTGESHQPPGNAFQEVPEAGLSQAITTRFLNANPQPVISHLDAQSYYHNFFLGDEAHWASKVHEYQQVEYCGLYDHIDLKLRSVGSTVKYDLVVAPGGRPADIVMEWAGAGEIYLSEGRLVVETVFGQLVEQEPFAYQLQGKDTVEIPARFRVDGRRVSFELPSGYDTTAALVIDPLLIFSTYSGSSADNWGNTATFDEAGNTYAGGIIFGASTGAFVPGTGVFQEDFRGKFDVVLMKFDSTGSQLLYATYLGGNEGETPISLIVNSANDLVVMGTTSSRFFPTTAGAFQRDFGGGDTIPPLDNQVTEYTNGSDLFVSLLSADGTSLKASTLLGGTKNDGLLPVRGPLTLNYGDQFRGEVHLDVNDNIYIASSTHSADFPTAGPAHGFSGEVDGVLVKLRKDLSGMIWGTFVGGPGVDALFSVKPSPSGGVYAAGGTTSTALAFEINGWKRSNSGEAEGLLLHFDENTGKVDRSTFLGTREADQAYLIDLDLAGNVYVVGQTKGNYFVTGDAYINPGSGQFLQKFHPDLRTTAWSTVFGSGSVPSNISPTAFLVSECGNIYISGWGGGNNQQDPDYAQGDTRNMPLTADAIQTTTDGRDFYLMVLEPDARALRYATYFGGIPSFDHVDGGTSRFDKRGVVHHAVCAGCGQNQSNYPTTTGAWSEVNNSTNCNLGVFKFDLSTLSASFSTNTPDLKNPEVKEGCAPFTFLFTNKSVGGETYFWTLGDGATSTNPDTVLHTYAAAGEYTITLTVTNPNTCKNRDVVSKKIVLQQGTYTISPSTTICYGESVQLEATGGSSYYWLPQPSLSDNTVSSPVADPRNTTTYFVTIYNAANKCTFQDSVTVNVLDEIRIQSQIEAVYDCEGLSEYVFTANVQGSDAAYWDFGDGTQTTELTGTHVYATTGNYLARLVAPNALCVEEVSEALPVGELLVPNAFSPNGDGINDRFEVKYVQPLPVTIVDRHGKLIFESDAYTNQWDGGNLPAGVYYYDVTLPDLSRCNGWVQLMR